MGQSAQPLIRSHRCSPPAEHLTPRGQPARVTQRRHYPRSTNVPVTRELRPLALLGPVRLTSGVRHESRALSPRPDTVDEVATEFGTVRVYQHGPDGGLPVVLIHGFYLTWAMWREQVGCLTGDFTAYAMDMLGQPGESTPSKATLTAAACARAIDPVLEGLTCLPGCSRPASPPSPHPCAPPMLLCHDRLLRSVRVLVQVLLAGETVHDPNKGIQRMKSVVPGWRYHLWPNATHALPAEIPDEVNACIRQFVKEHRNHA